jgi:iodotyrosine deiodinase
LRHPQSQNQKKIREAAEKEEFINYHGRMVGQWRNDLKPLDTNRLQPFIETAPWLIVVFRKGYEMEADGKNQNIMCRNRQDRPADFC